MPEPSGLAARLAEDLVEVGKIFGFEAEKEQPIQEGSKFRIDVFWKLRMPETSLFPNINIASIEIQYSDSPTSISHNIFKAEKTLHPSIHVLISYSKLSADYKENVLKPNYPLSGLVIIDGEEKVRKLNLWITRFLTIKNEENRLVEKGRMIRDFAISKLPHIDKLKMEERILESFKSEIEEVFLPPEVASLIETFLEVESKGLEHDREIIDDIFYMLIESVQSKLQKYNIPRVYVTAHLLFSEFNIEPEFAMLGAELRDDIEIEPNKVIIRDTNGYPLDVNVEDGNAHIESEAGTVCVEGLNAEGIIVFIKEASEEIKKQILKYSISEDEKKTFDAIRTALN